MATLLLLSILILLAFGVAIIVNRFGVPRITSYILIGILASPYLLGQFFEFPYSSLSERITNIALGIIAFLIGLEIDWSVIRKNRLIIFFGTIGQVFLSITVVILLVYLYGYLFTNNIDFKFALVLGAISATTAPAGTMAIIEEYGAKGVLTSILLGIVILDDALGVVAFEILTNLTNNRPMIDTIISIIYHIGGSIFLGAGLGCISGLLTRCLKQEELRFPLFIALILIGTSTATLLDISPILVCMSLGLVTQSLSNQNPEDIIKPIKHIEEFVFIIFFIFAGIHFNPNIFAENLVLIFIYIFARAVGKYFGAYWGSRLGGATSDSSKWLGLCLFPQAGVALGLALSLLHREDCAAQAGLVINVIMGAIVIYELVGPFLTKYALTKSGDIEKS